MGLDVSHDCWHGAYSAFHAWRIELAKAAGVPLLLMDSYWEEAGPIGIGEKIRDRVARLEAPPAFTPMPGGGFEATCDSLMASLKVRMQMDPDTYAMHQTLRTVLPWLPLRWDQLRPDIIHVLLNHSDCDGTIAVKDCLPLAIRLEELIPLLPEGGNGGHVHTWRGKTQTFADGLRLAAKKRQIVRFR